MKTFFDNLKEEVKNVSPCSIFSYDETNMTDDTTKKKCIVLCGLRRVEAKKKRSKKAFSVIFCGSSSGAYLPPMAVYKAQHYYKVWTTGGQSGAIYDATKSCWLDEPTFLRWFFELFLPEAVTLPGIKVLIGDKLVSHFSIDVTNACLENAVRLIFFIPNTTHLCQPLDLAVSRHTKALWRHILQSWRSETKSKGIVPKEIFPSLLKRVFVNLKSENLVSGFRACVLFPLIRSRC